MKFTERQLQVDLETAGGQMANILFNVSQRPGEPLASEIAASMDTARRNWDLALGRVRQVKHLTGGQAPTAVFDIDQVRKDFENGTLICRATIDLLIDALSADQQDAARYRVLRAGNHTRCPFIAVSVTNLDQGYLPECLDHVCDYIIADQAAPKEQDHG